MRARTRARTLPGIVALLVMTFLVPVVVKGETQAIVWTDKQDYLPGDTAMIRGSRFLANTLVNVSVTRPDLAVSSWSLTSDSAGNFTTSYQLDGVTGTYTVKATDGTNTATTTFTDARPLQFTESGLPVGTTWSVTVTGLSPSTKSSTTTGPTDIIAYDDVAEGTSWPYSVESPISGGTGVQYVASPSSGTASIPTGSGPVTVSITFTTQYQVSFAVYPSGSGTTTPSGRDFYSGSISISAFPSTDYVFSSWSTSTSDITITSPSSATTTATINGPGTITANFQLATATITFYQTGVGTDFTGTVLTVDGTGYDVADIPGSGKAFTWNIGSEHTFAYTSPLVVTVNGKQYVWTSTTGLSTAKSGTITVPSGGGSVTGNYKTQYYITAKYSTSDGSTPSASVVLSGTQSGFDFTLVLTTSNQHPWLDAGTQWSVNNPIPYSPTTERWIATSGTSGTVTGTITIAPRYYHQLKTTLSYIVLGGGSPMAPTFTANQFGSSYGQVLMNTPIDYWFDAGSSWTVTNPLAGSTSSERWVAAGPVSGTISSAMTISPTYSRQFYLDVSGRAAGSGWYESGSTAKVTTLGIYGRSSGMGFRIVSYSIDGGAPVNVSPTTGNIDVTILMGAPHRLVFNSVTQYEVRLDAGAVESLNYITAPTVSGDKYWYDTGTSVDVMLNGVWNRASGTGKRLVSYAIIGKGETPIARLGKVTALSLASITSPQYITTKITTQFMLSTPSGSLASITATPISGDTGWYDLGTVVRAVYNYVWNVTADQSRTNAIGFNIDGGTENTLPRAGSGTFTATVTMNAPHTINIASVIQYLIYFRFTDNSSSRQIIPTSFEIDVQGVGVEEVQGSRIWLDRGSSFRISKEIWGNMDVKPQDQVVYRVDRPLNETIRSRIFDGKLKVIDMLGISTSGAQVIATLANGTQIAGITDLDGYFIIPMIPLGGFNATISNLGASTQIDGDASKQSVTVAKVVLSYPTIIAIAIIAVVACLIYWIQNPPRVRKLGLPIGKKSQPKRLPTATAI